MLHLCIRISMPCTMADTLQQILIPIMALCYKCLIPLTFKLYRKSFNMCVLVTYYNT